MASIWSTSSAVPLRSVTCRPRPLAIAANEVLFRAGIAAHVIITLTNVPLARALQGRESPGGPADRVLHARRHRDRSASLFSQVAHPILAA